MRTESLSTPVTSASLQLFFVGLVFGLIGLWYAGPMFLTHFGDAIPVGAAGGQVGHMIPGDQYEAYYRHTLPYYNIQHGHSLLYSGYQYNLGQREPFVDGMIYLPFALLVSLLAIVIGPVAAFNAVAILSFSLCAVSGYLLGKTLTSSWIGGWVSAAVLSLLPFRVGFLFGEMFYATDMMFVPLALFFFVRFLQSKRWSHAAGFGITVLALSMANFALLYWFLLFFSPLFILLAAWLVMQERNNWKALIPGAAAVALPLLVMAVYLLHVKTVMGESGLRAGQHISEVRTFSPILADLINKWNGIERTIYLGFAGLLGVAGGILNLRGGNRRWDFVLAVRLYLMLMFPLIYILALGTTFSSLTDIYLYEWMFHYIPFADGSRTPGRLMPLVATCCAPLAGYAVVWMAGKFRGISFRATLAALVVAVIAIDFKFSSATMTTLDASNGAYAAIAGEDKDAGVLAIPLQFEADHYLNTTYQFYGLINDLKIANGHSSTFPVEWHAFESIADPLNHGEATRSVLNELVRRNIRYIAVHMTQSEPRAAPIVAAALDRNPALKRTVVDNGIQVYRIQSPALAPEFIDVDDYLEALTASANVDGEASDVQLLSGWYDREAYPGQIPFRWMAGTQSIALVRPNRRGEPDDLTFSYKCPAGRLDVRGRDTAVTRTDALADGWTKVTIDLPDGKVSALGISAPVLYTVPTDERKFGCMVSDLNIH